MPCPFFQPLRVVDHSRWRDGRWPLIDEYQGQCTSSESVRPVSGECCNQGYPRGLCEHFPAAETRSAMRFTVLQQSDGTLRVLCIEEVEHTPRSFRELQYAIADGVLTFAGADAVLRDQALAFCRSYLSHIARG